MPNNDYVNKVNFGGTTIMDITDTTAGASDVIEGQVFYRNTGARTVGTLGDATQANHGLMSAVDKTKIDTLNPYTCDDYAVAIATTDWDNNISYTWTNAAITPTCYIEIAFNEPQLDGIFRGYLTSEISNGSLIITASHLPTATLHLIITVWDALSTFAPGVMTETDPTVPLWAKAETKPSYTAVEVGALPADTFIPLNTSELINDAGFLTSYTETDPTVPEWAKAAQKPVYTAAEVGALPDTTIIPTVPTDISSFNNDMGYITNADIPTNVSDLINDAGYLTTHQDISTKANVEDLAAVATSGDYSDLLNVPTNVSTFSNDSGYITEHQDISGKVDVVEGYGLSQNDFTNEEKSKLDEMINDNSNNLTTTWSSRKLTNKFNDLMAFTDTTTIENNSYVYRKCGNGTIGDRNGLRDTIIGGTIVWNQLVQGEGTVIVPNTHKYISYINNEWSMAISTGAEIEVGATDMIIDLTKMVGIVNANNIYSVEQETSGAGIKWFREFFPEINYPYNAGELVHVHVDAHRILGRNLIVPEEFIQGTLSATGEVEDNENWITSGWIQVTEQTVSLLAQKRGAEANLVSHFSEYDAAKQFIQDTPYLNVTDITNFRRTLNLNANTRYIRISVGFYNKPTTPVDYFVTNDIQLILGSAQESFLGYYNQIYNFDPTVDLRGTLVWNNGVIRNNGDMYKSDGTIQRNYGVVDLGSLSWTKIANRYYYIFPADIHMPKAFALNAYANIMCAKYITIPGSELSNGTENEVISLHTNANSTYINIRDTRYTNGTDLAQALRGTYLIYELALPFYESGDPFEPAQRIYASGMEEFISNRMTAPVGHNGEYGEYLRLKADGTPDISYIYSNFNTLEECLAPVMRGDTAAQELAEGTYFFLKNNSTLPNGLYKALTSLRINDTFTNENIQKDTSGIINIILSMI